MRLGLHAVGFQHGHHSLPRLALPLQRHDLRDELLRLFRLRKPGDSRPKARRKQKTAQGERAANRPWFRDPISSDGQESQHAHFLALHTLVTNCYLQAVQSQREQQASPMRKVTHRASSKWKKGRRRSQRQLRGVRPRTWRIFAVHLMFKSCN